MSQRQALLEEIAACIATMKLDRIVKVAIDGVDGVGKTTFADDLAEFVRERRPVIRASVDGFHNPRAVRYRLGKQSPEGFFRDSYNYAALKQLLLEPLSHRGNGRYVSAIFDSTSDAGVPIIERAAAPNSALLFDGIFLHRPELSDYWDFSIFLRADFAISAARGAVRDGTSPDPNAESNRRYVEGQRIYFAECQPEARASLIVDYNDLDFPKLLPRP